MPRPSFFHHLHPPMIPAVQARWRYTLGAGGLCLYLVVLLLVTGALEMFYYVATPEQAPLTVQAITYLVPYGALLRNLHFWAGQILVVVSALHLVRVVLTGAYAPPRRFNYLLGLAQFILILVLDWSGNVLRWDEGIRWALVVGTQLFRSVPFIGETLYRMVVGGTHPDLATLTRFYAAHIFGITFILLILTAWHIFRVRRDGGISAPPQARPAGEARITRFELVRREALMIVLATIALLLLSTFVPAPIAQPIKSLSEAPANTDMFAPWYFLWIQSLVRLGDPFWMGVVIPGVVFLALVLIPYIFPAPPPDERGRWFPPHGRLVQVIFCSLALAVIALSLWMYFA